MDYDDPMHGGDLFATPKWRFFALLWLLVFASGCFPESTTLTPKGGGQDDSPPRVREARDGSKPKTDDAMQDSPLAFSISTEHLRTRSSKSWAPPTTLARTAGTARPFTKTPGADVLRDLESLQWVDVEHQRKRYRLRSEVRGVCSQVFQAVGVAFPTTLEQRTD